MKRKVTEFIPAYPGQGKTPEQKRVIKFFLNSSGCFGKTMSMEEYKQMVYQKLKSQDFKSRAIFKLGIDPSQCNLVAPIALTSFLYDTDDYDYIKAENAEVVTNSFGLTWIFFGVDCMYAYQYKFNMTSDVIVEITNEVHYKDIVEVETIHNSREKFLREGCLQTGCIWISPNKYIYQYDYLKVSVPGNTLTFGMKNNPNLENAIMGVKQLIRDKKLSD